MDMNQVGQNAWTPGVQHDTFIPDQLLSGPLQVVTDTGTITGGDYKRGTVLGQITATKKYISCLKTATDGSEKPCAILVDDVNASAHGEQPGGLYLMGEFNQNRVIIDGSWALADIKTALRPFGIFLRDSVKTPTS